MNIDTIFDTMNYGPAPEGRVEALDWISAHDGQFGHYVNGAFTSAGKDRFDTVNPADGMVLAQIAQANTSDVDAAVAAARKAQSKWAALGGHGRAKYLYALARLVQKHARLFAVLECLDNGKTIRETRDIDIPLVTRHFYHHAGWAQLMESEMAGFEAVGVAGQIIPWNFPLLMLSWKVAPALAMGNTVVLKPAEQTSLSALLFAEICAEAGLPNGVVNIITGDGRVGEMMTTHDDIDKIAFTGSTDVGRKIREATAGSGKKLTLELGGKSPFIVFDDADLDSAVEGVVDAIWFNQGQVCCAGSRLLVQEAVADTMIDKLTARMATLRLGDPMDKCTDVGAIIDQTQRDRIASLVDAGVRDGARLIQSSSVPELGCFYPPTLLVDVEPASAAAQEEIFGPVLVTTTFRTPSEATALANNTRYGLAASIWTENINLALDLAPKIQAGVVWINSTNLFDAAAGFGGYRESGFGREGGREGLFEYVKPSYLAKLKPAKVAAKVAQTGATLADASDGLLDRTAKMYIGGKQARPDGGYSTPVLSSKGALLGHVGKGNRKDIRNAVEAATKAAGWASASGHLRAQILYYIAENLSVRADEFADRIRQMTGASGKAAHSEVEATVSRLFTYGAWADKHDGAVHSVPIRGVALAMNEPNGVMGLCCPDAAPLLGLISMIAPAIATGNRVVAVPSPLHPLSATDLYQVLETSDLPAGVVNIVTGDRDELAKTLADHYGVSALWYDGPAEGCAKVEHASAANLKRSWVSGGLARDWHSRDQSEGREFLRHATQVKNIWVPYGE